MSYILFLVRRTKKYYGKTQGIDTQKYGKKRELKT